MPKRRVAQASSDVADDPVSIVAAVKSGNRLAILDAMALRLARAMDDPKTASRDLAALSRRQLEVDAEIEAIRVEQDLEQSVVVKVPDEPFDGTDY